MGKNIKARWGKAYVLLMHTVYVSSWLGNKFLSMVDEIYEFLAKRL